MLLSQSEGEHGKHEKVSSCVTSVSAKRKQHIDNEQCMSNSAKKARTFVREIDAMTLHRRTGHLNVQAMQKLVSRAKNVRLVNTTALKDCTACIKGKQHRTPVNRPSKGSRVGDILHLVHSDLCGPMATQSMSHAKYMMTIIDDHSRYTTVYFLKHKSEAADKLKQFIAMCKTRLNKSVVRIRSDNGGEYTSDALSEELKKLGIEHQFVPPYAHEFSGVAERMNRTIMDMVRSMLFDANLPPTFWEEAANTAVYIRNRAPNSTLNNVTPHEVWTGQPADLSHLRVFGCRAWVHVPDEVRRQLEPKSVPAVMLGYENDSTSTYRVWLVESQRTYATRDVKFIESELPGNTKPTNDTQTPMVTTHHLNDDVNNATVRRSERHRTFTEPHWIKHPEYDNSVYAYSHETPLMNHNDMQAHETGPLNDWTAQFPDALDIDSEWRQLSDEPTSYSEAMKRPDRLQWIQAMETEMKSMELAEVWDLIPLKLDMQPIGCRWVFKIKRKADGTIDRYKARLVAQGFTQQFGLDFVETYAPVAKFATIRLMLALVAQHDLELHQMDVETAYLNGVLDVNIIMHQPDGFIQPGGQHLTCRLKKSLYGLKQSGRLWYQRMDDALTNQHGFTRLANDHCFYHRKDAQTDNIVWVALYVDDLLIAANSLDELNKFKSALSSTFKMKDLGEAKYVLGIQICRDRAKKTLTIDQSRYVADIATRFDLNDSRDVSTPMEHKLKLSKDNCPKTDVERQEMAKVPYREALGAATYAMVGTRPDTAFAITKLGQFANNPGPVHWNALKRLLRYLKSTSHYSITYSGSSSNCTATLSGMADSDFAADTDDCKSISGYAFLLAGAAISWSAKRQTTVAQSTTESEYYGYNYAAREAMWLRELMAQFYNPTNQAPTTILADNEGAIALSKDPKFHQRTKHIGVQWHYVRERVLRKDVQLTYVHTNKLGADVLTKALTLDQHNRCITQFGILNYNRKDE